MGRPAVRRNKANYQAADVLMGVFGYTRETKCASCVHYDNKTSTCRANAPAPRMVPNMASQFDESVLWPMVAGDEWSSMHLGREMEIQTK